MTDMYATLPEPSLSLPIRMEKQKKRTRAGVAATITGVALLAAGVYNFTKGGAELVAIWLTLMAAGLIVVGLNALLRPAKTY